MTLSPAQLHAVERTNQDVCVVAGPGSGKTRVLIERFAWLVEFHHLNPSRILAITFTEKAATEIKERLIRRFQDSGHREAIERAWVSTIDGFCTRLLREHAEASVIAPDFSVLEQSTAERLARESAEEALDELYAENPAQIRRLLEALDLSTGDLGRKPDLAASLLDVYESMRISGVEEIPTPQAPADLFPEALRLARKLLEDTGKPGKDTPKLLEWIANFLALPVSSITTEHFKIAGSFTAHVSWIGKSRTDDAKALKNDILPALLAQWIETHHAGLRDLLREALFRLDRTYRKKKREQSSLDFADLEEESIRLLESNFFIRQATRQRFDQILMDELQDTNPLQWRLLNLIRSPDAFFGVGDINQSIYGFRHADPAVFEQYRHHLETQGAVIDDLRENHRSRQPILDAVSEVLANQPGIEPRPLIAAKSFPPVLGPIVERLVGEGEDVEASLVAERILQLGYEYKDIAILVRSLNALEPFTRALDRFHIPFVITGGKTFLEAREIRDLLAFMAVLVNPLDEVALVAVLRSPIVGLSDEEIFRIGKSGWQQLFEHRFGHLRKKAGFVSPDRLLPILPDQTPRARANVDKLCSWLRRQQPRPLAEILDDLGYLSESEASPPEAGNVVQLMSIHSAKGLEFKAVFVSALQREPDKSSPVIVFSDGIGAKWRNPVTGEPLPDSLYAAHKVQRKAREQAEENRLLYVAMTRAEERLFLTYTRGKNSRGWQKLVESTIVAELASSTVISAPPRPEIGPRDAVQFIDPPKLTGQHDSTVAVTAVSLFEACPRKYYLAKYLGLEQPVSEAMSVGSEVHKILAGGSSNSLEAQELARRFPMPTHASRLEREFDFMLAVEDVVLRGQIDLWYEQDGEITVVDFKTDREEAPENYALQLRFYALALERYLGRLPDRAVLFYLRSGSALQISLGLNDLKSAISALRELLQGQKTMVFPLHEGSHCLRCEFYQGLCPAGKN